jgi:3-hydroxyisobutyrate dehydrogenase
VLGAMPRHAWFSVPMIQKDMQLALDHGHAVGVPLPTTALVQQWLTMAGATGAGDRDFGALFDVLASLSGVAPSAPPTA